MLYNEAIASAQEVWGGGFWLRSASRWPATTSQEWCWGGVGHPSALRIQKLLRRNFRGTPWHGRAQFQFASRSSGGGFLIGEKRGLPVHDVDSCPITQFRAPLGLAGLA
jgi:hypothetical protein